MAVGCEAVGVDPIPNVSLEFSVNFTDYVRGAKTFKRIA